MTFSVMRCIMYQNLVVPKDISKNSLADFAYNIIRENIMEFRLVPGNVINEAELADFLKVSRTPVHEAVARLRDDRLISVIPRKESKVTPIIVPYVNEGVFMRCCIEPEIIKIASKNFGTEYKIALSKNLEVQKQILEEGTELYRFYPVDDEFHRILYNGTNKMETYSMVQKMVTHLDRVRYLVRYEGSFNIEAISYEDHVDILNMILSNTVIGYDLHAFMERHIVRFQTNIKLLRAKYPDYFIDIQQ
ncbi:MAG: GntR family transcriptional regulator [Oscillospiraceae bacterium]